MREIALMSLPEIITYISSVFNVCVTPQWEIMVTVLGKNVILTQIAIHHNSSCFSPYNTSHLVLLGSFR